MNVTMIRAQQSSWSIKKVLPAVVSELRQDTLDGGMAMKAFVEGILRIPHLSAKPKSNSNS
ncbi:MAG: hypothetical protein ABTQ25_06535 [Nitrosomonas ureae]